MIRITAIKPGAQNEICRDPGTYIMILHGNARQSIRVGARGPLQLQPGYYLYAGSALGPGGLKARLGRHLAGAGCPRWHIDYLRQVTQPFAAWFSSGRDCREHTWARALSNASGIAPVLPGLGASDCNCATHLFYSQSAPLVADFNNSLQRL